MDDRISRRDQWKAWLGEFRDSGLTIKKFCQRIGVSENRFYHWRNKLANESASESAKREDVETFVPVSVIAPEQDNRSKEWRIDLPGGAILRVPGDESSLRMALTCLLEAKVPS